MIKQLPAFHALPNYSALTKDGIKAQFRFRDSVGLNEATNQPITRSGNTVIENGYLETGSNGVYEFDPGYFVAGDFTIEAKVTFLRWSDRDGSYVFGNYHSTASVGDSWNLRVAHASSSFRMYFSKPGTVIGTADVPGAPAIQLNVEYHVVAERVGDLVSLYVDGELYATRIYAGPLHKPASTKVTSETTSNGYGRCNRRIRDIRIADRALYHGAIYDNFKGIQGGRAISRIVHNGKLLTGTATGVQQTETSVNIVTGNTFISIPHNPAFAVGTGDFRFEITFVYQGEFSNWPSKVNPLLTWSTWQAQGQPGNMEFCWSPGAAGLFMGIGSYNATQVTFGGGPPVIGERYAVVFERRNGVLSCYLNGELLGTQDLTQAINVNVNRPILIGTRYGGGGGEVHWTTLMEIEHCWFGIPGEEQS